MVLPSHSASFDTLLVFCIACCVRRVNRCPLKGINKTLHVLLDLFARQTDHCEMTFVESRDEGMTAHWTGHRIPPLGKKKSIPIAVRLSEYGFRVKKILLISVLELTA